MFVSDSSHCHPADSVLDTNILLYLMLFVQVFVVVLNKEDRERDRACVSITSSLVPGATPVN